MPHRNPHVPSKTPIKTSGDPLYALLEHSSRAGPNQSYGLSTGDGLQNLQNITARGCGGAGGGQDGATALSCVIMDFFLFSHNS